MRRGSVARRQTCNEGGMSVCSWALRWQLKADTVARAPTRSGGLTGRRSAHECGGPAT
jgi:hypothetical protein